MRKRTFVFIAALLFVHVSYASIKSGAQALIDGVSPTVNLGIKVVDVTTGATLYERNQDKNFIPASNMKLFSDAAALMVLGPDYRFVNQLSTPAKKLQQGVLDGPLYLYLSGDPSFNKKRLRILLASLSRWKIHTIKGNIVIDSTHAPVAPYAPGIVPKDMLYSYGAPIAPLMIDANRMRVFVNPGIKVGDPAIVEVQDATASTEIANEVKTKPQGKGCGVDISMDTNNHLTVRGCIGIGEWALVQRLAIRNPLLYAQNLIRKELQRNAIRLEGEIVLGTVPKDSMLLAIDKSKPIAQLMADTLKPSDNLYADSLFLHAAYILQGYPVGWEEAKEVVKAFLQKQTGIPLQTAILADGSGLSRQDILTPNQTVSLLKFLYERFPLSYEYIAALPVSGRDGTLQKRFKRPEQQDMVRAKTGTMTGIISLSGYLYTANAHTLAFAMYINVLPHTKPIVAGRSRYLIDALCSYFLKQKPGNNTWARVFSSYPRINYQLKPTQAQLQRHHQALWRRLETVIKQALKGHNVVVLFRPQELILKDDEADTVPVLQALSQVKRKYPFTVLLSSTTPFQKNSDFVLWSDMPFLQGATRTWVVRKAADSSYL